MNQREAMEALLAGATLIIPSIRTYTRLTDRGLEVRSGEEGIWQTSGVLTLPDCIECVEPIDVKPCPFCGCKAEIKVSDEPDSRGRRMEWVECLNGLCEAQGPVYYRETRSHRRAVIAWNRRAGE